EAAVEGAFTHRSEQFQRFAANALVHGPTPSSSEEAGGFHLLRLQVGQVGGLALQNVETHQLREGDFDRLAEVSRAFTRPCVGRAATSTVRFRKASRRGASPATR